MENLLRLSTQIDALIAALQTAQAESRQVRKELLESKTACAEKEARIQTLEHAAEEQTKRLKTLEVSSAEKDAQLGTLITRIEQVLSALHPAHDNL